MSTAAKPALETAIVTKAELLELADAEKRFAKATKDQNEAKGEVERRRQAVAEKVFGIKTSDELKILAPKELLKLLGRRFESGKWQPEKSAPEFSFVQTHSGRYPAWKQVYIDAHSESEAAEIVEDTPYTYSYRVSVAV
jgi:hypothetical protein